MNIALSEHFGLGAVLTAIRNFPPPIVAIGFFLVWLLVWLPFAYPLIVKAEWYPFKSLSVDQKLPLVGSLYLLVPLLLWGASYLTGLQWADLGWRWQVDFCWEILTGLGMGAIGLLILFGLQAALGWIAPKPESWPMVRAALLPTLFIGIWISTTEEAVFRGFLQSLLEKTYFPWVVATIVSLVFALLHAIWEGKEAIPQLLGLWLMGMVLTLARWSQEGSLGLAIGLHAGWIWTMATLDSGGVLVPTGKGPKVLTGFGQKPLAGLLGIFFLLVTGWVVMGGWLKFLHS